MTTIQTRTAPSRRVPPAARQPGPVTRAIRGLRPNEAPTWEMRQREIDAEERAAMRALRRRVAEAVTVAIDFLDATGGDPDLESDADDEPSLCGASSTSLGGTLAPSTSLGDDREDDAGDNPEEENEHASDCDLGEDSLGSLGGTAPGLGGAQTSWAGGGAADLEAVNEDGGDINDEPHDEDTDLEEEPDLEDGNDTEAVNEDGEGMQGEIAHARPTPPDPALAMSRSNRINFDPNALDDLYAMRCSGTCLEPVYMDGALLLMDPTAPYKNGDFVVVYRRPEFCRPNEPQAIVKRLVMHVKPPKPGADPARTSNIMPCLVVEMLNPPRTFTILWEQVLAVHKMVGNVPAHWKTHVVPQAQLAARSQAA